jgi:methionyl-tRNA formyltransferase
VRLAYFGTPADAVAPLDALVAAGHDVALVVTQPDRRRGRGAALDPSPVRIAAERHGIPVRTPARSGELVNEIRALDLELGVVVAFGQLLPPALLAATRSGFVNVHFSLLPRWRGAAPVERAILAGDAETGVWLMAMEEGLDTGGCYAEARTSIRPDETAGELRVRLGALGVALLVEHLDAIPGSVPRPQVGDPTYAKKLAADEFRLDCADPAIELARRVRAGNPKPGAFTLVDGKRLKVLRARPLSAVAAEVPGTVLAGTVLAGPPVAVVAGDGLLELVEVQPEGRTAMTAAAWLAGRHGRPTAFEPR